MSASTASGLAGSGNPQGSSSRHVDGQQGNNTTQQTSTPSGFNFEPASIFDWASSHHPTHARASNASPYYQAQSTQQQPQQGTSQPTHSLDLVNALGGNNAGGGPQTSLNPAATQHQNINNNNNNNDDDDDEDEDDDDDDDDENGNVSGRQGKNNGNTSTSSGVGRKRVRGSGPTHRLNRKGGGRPKDFIWAYFDEHFTPTPTAENPNYVRHSAECKACGWTCEQPKAFRMRQHVVHSCENLPDAEKQRVQAIQSQKDAAAELKKRSKRSVSDGLGGGASPLMGNNNAGMQGGDGRGGGGDNGLNGSFGDMFSRLSGAHPHGNAGDAAFYSYSALSGGGGGDASTSAAGGGVPAAGGSGLPGSAPTGGVDKDIGNSGYNKGGNTTTGSNKKRRKKEDSTSAPGIASNWHLGSFLNLPPGKMGKSPITCHVLDSSAGRPGANIKIRMDQLSQTGFMHVATGETDADGRNNSLLSSTLKVDKNSIYKMTFYTREYFNSKGIESFYPFVEVVFEVKEPDEHHHIALLLSPFSYTTYRGS